MRLWHYKLIPVLPKKQLVAQWRELWGIVGNIKCYGNPNHVLVNRIMNYDLIHLTHYAGLVYEELLKRNYQPRKSLEKFNDFVISVYPDVKTRPEFKGVLFKGWHEPRYFSQCYYNLQEKYDCGGITQKEWDKIQELAPLHILPSEV